MIKLKINDTFKHTEKKAAVNIEAIVPFLR